MEGLVGGLPDLLRFIFAFLVVLLLLVGGAALWRRFGNALPRTSTTDGRQPRLSVIDAATIDASRRLILIRRDDTEHLLMIGGPTDIVIEPNITRGGSAREAWRLPVGEAHPPPLAAAWPQPAPLARPDPLRLPREPMAADPMQALRTDLASRLSPQGAAEATQPAFTPLPTEALSAAPEAEVKPVRAPEPPPLTTYEPVFQTSPDLRPPAPAAVEPPWPSPDPRRPGGPVRPPAEAAIQAPEELLLASAPARDNDLGADGERNAHRPPPPPPPPRPTPSDEHTLAEMAQRLEAALRRPTRPVETVPQPTLGPAAPSFPAVPPAATVPQPSRPIPPSQPGAAAPPVHPAHQFEPPLREGSTASGNGFGAPEIPEDTGPPLSLESEIANLIPRPTGKT
jgi:flagellar protein FliO/FliZ